MARDTPDALQKMAQASAFGDLMEIRLDVMETFDLGEIIRAASKPVIATYRSIKEGGIGQAPLWRTHGLSQGSCETGIGFRGH